MAGKHTLFLLLLCFGLVVQSKEIPPPNEGNRAFVKDVAGVLTEAQEIALANKLKGTFDSTGNQIVVFADKSTDGIPIFNYSVDVAEEWGIGEEKEDNGILVYAAIEDRKVFIQVGRGLEGAVPDYWAKKIVEDRIIPNFKRGDYFRGFDEATDMLIDLSAGEYKNTRMPDNGFPVWLIIVIIIIVLIILSRFGDNDGKTYRGRRRGGVSPWIIGGGGGSLGGGGGGFGGFGGGSFGGGGAGGSW
jgi:uncharacterized protein